LRWASAGSRCFAPGRARCSRCKPTAHIAAPLADGLLGGNTLICPLHARKFDLETGKGETEDCSLETYAARLNRAGQIVVELRSLDG